GREPFLLLKRFVALVEEKLVWLRRARRHRTPPARGTCPHKQCAAENGNDKSPADAGSDARNQTCSSVPFSHACSAASPCSRFTDGAKPRSARARAVSA